MSGKNDLNDILDAALDELDDDSDDSCVDTMGQEHISETIVPQVEEQDMLTRPVFGPPRPPSPGEQTTSASVTEEEKAVIEMMRQMKNLFPSEDCGKEGNTHMNLALEKKEELDTKPGRNQDVNSKGGEMNDTVSQLLKELSKTEDFDDSAFQNFGDEMTEEMQTEWEETMKKASGDSISNEDGDAMEDVVGGMMKQLLSKEFMYEPMRDISEKFPKWLAENKEKLSSEEYEK